MRRIGAAFLLAVLVLVAACDPRSVDAARLCRATLPALNPSGTIVHVTRSFGETGGIHINYVATRDGQSRHRFVVCGFERGTLQSVTTERGALGDASVYFLKRFYLATPEALWNEPADAPREDLPLLPVTLALLVQQGLAALPSLAIYALIAASYALIYGLVGRILFGFGEFAVIGGTATTVFITAGLVGAPSLPVSVMLGGLLIGLAAAAWHGMAAERIVIAPLVARRGLPILIATAGMTMALAEYVRLAQGTTGRWLPPLLSFPVMVARSADFVVTFTPIALIAAGMGLVAALVLVRLIDRTGFGRDWRAMADDPVAAALCGVDRRALFTLTFLLATALSGLAGILTVLSFGGVGYAQGLMLTLKALTAAILGGIGSVRGALWGGVALGLFEALWSAIMPIESRDIAVFALLALALVVRPGGFFGERSGVPRAV